MKVICGDANPNGNISLTSKGGCGKELDIIDAYRCTGCGVYFHLDCIYKHFEEEEKHDVARNCLKKIFDYVAITTTRGEKISDGKILRLSLKGLSRQKKNRRASLRQGDYTAKIYDLKNKTTESAILYADSEKEALKMIKDIAGKGKIIKLVKN